MKDVLEHYIIHNNTTHGLNRGTAYLIISQHRDCNREQQRNIADQAATLKYVMPQHGDCNSEVHYSRAMVNVETVIEHYTRAPRHKGSAQNAIYNAAAQKGTAIETALSAILSRLSYS